jgi:hypothetical protein
MKLIILLLLISISNLVICQTKFTKKGIEGYELGKDFKDFTNLQKLKTNTDFTAIDCMEVYGFDYYLLDTTLNITELGKTKYFVVAFNDKQKLTDIFFYLEEKKEGYKKFMDSLMGKQKMETYSPFARGGLWENEQCMVTIVSEDGNGGLQFDTHADFTYNKPRPYVSFRSK